RLDKRRLPSSERGALRAHLRECNECAVLERRQRAQRATLKNLGGVPLPASLGSFFGGGAAGGGAAAAGIGIGAKVATVLVAGTDAPPVDPSYDHRDRRRGGTRRRRAPAASGPAPAAPSAACASGATSCAASAASTAAIAAATGPPPAAAARPVADRKNTAPTA